MIVTGIRLKNFRNHSQSSCQFGTGINALLGNNGQGKTNILEAISYLSLTKSFYAASDAAVLQFGKEFFEVEGTVLSVAGLEHAVRVLYPGALGGKVFTINGSPPETVASVIGRFPVVVLSPEKNAITFGGPVERRKFIDLVLSQTSRVYFEDLLEYRKVLRQRNRILFEAKHAGTGSPDSLEPWSIGLVQYGSRIINRRSQFVREFQDYIRRAYGEIVEDLEEPGISYSSCCDSADASSVDAIAAAMTREMERRQGEEQRRAVTLVGPHRDELKLSINGVSVQQFASQGQHKTFFLALKVGEFFYLRERKAEPPILLLDDVFSELDEGRSRRILDLVGNLGQVIMTSTSEEVFHRCLDWNDHHRRFRIENGTCRKV